MEPYRTKPSTKGMPYWEVPVDVLENRGELKIWAEKAIEVAIRNKK
jgi:DNA transformation protein